MKVPALSVLKAMETDLPTEPRPFLKLADRFGTTEQEVLEALQRGLETGLVRRYGARIAHQQAGYAANVLVVWQVEHSELDRMGFLMAAHPAVSHCYERPVIEGFPYNLYTMIHGRSRAECEQVIAQLAEKSGLTSYRTLWTVKEYKKSVPRYSELLLAEDERETKCG